jgi:serine/threonine-protein kinase
MWLVGSRKLPATEILPTHDLHSNCEQEMRIGQKVGPFQIESELGSGAMGQVYLARYIKNGQRAAIKVIAAGLRNSTAQARFQREAEVLEQLDHPNIVRFYVVSEFEGAPYYAMEFVEGEPLDSLLERRGKLPWDDVVEIGKQVCAALQHAHEKGIIHRDLKPSNLMIMKDGTVKLTDFGIAKDLDVAQLTATNNTVGTAAYMSPEQCRGERNLTHKSDLYSLGVVLYELLVGNKPFEAETTMDLFLAHVQGTFERPSRKILDIPVWLDNLVCQLLEKKPEQRPFDAAVVSQALLQVAEKIQAQSSAGVDAAKARLADRKSARSEGSSKDREAARELRRAAERKGKRRKSKQKRVFEEAWFQAVGLGGMLALVGILVYLSFRAPNSAVLYEKCKAIMDSNDRDAMLQARTDGPIKQYLRYFGTNDSPETEQVHQWVDEIDTAQREKTLINRKNLLKAASEGEEAARKALEAEAGSDFIKAKDSWQGVLKSKDVADAEGRPLKLVAEKHLRDLTRADEEEQELRQKIQTATNDFEIYSVPGEPQHTASRALRYESAGDWGAAQVAWNNLVGSENEIPIHWQYLAKRKAKEMAQKIEKTGDTGTTKIRLDALDASFAEAEKLVKERPQAAAFICLNIQDLYPKENDPDILQRLSKFQKLAMSLPQPARNK